VDIQPPEGFPEDQNAMPGGRWYARDWIQMGSGNGAYPKNMDISQAKMMRTQWILGTKPES